MTRCNCENSACAHRAGGCPLTGNPGKRAMYVGTICDACAERMPVEYMVKMEQHDRRCELLTVSDATLLTGFICGCAERRGRK